MLSNDVEDSTFTALPRRIRERIDRAFDIATKSSDPSPTKRRKVANHGADDPLATEHGGFIAEPQAGGFILEEPSGGFIVEGPSGGFVIEEPGDGFIPEGSTTGSSPNDPEVRANKRHDDAGADTTHIPLSLIPTALQILDLPPDDEQVLAVFKNAASGWTGAERSRRPCDDPNKAELVDKKDWRAVCSVLLAPQPADDEYADGSDGMVDSGEEYVGSGDDAHNSDSGGDDLDDEDYSETRDSSRTQTKSRRTRGSFPKSLDQEQYPRLPITARQKEASREAFALFLPHVPDSQLDSQIITVSDLVRVSKDLKEKLSYDQIMEMLSTISTSTDKLSVSLSDFEKMMVEAKMA